MAKSGSCGIISPERTALWEVVATSISCSPQSQSHPHRQDGNRKALPISVTTGSRGEPGSLAPMDCAQRLSSLILASQMALEGLPTQVQGQQKGIAFHGGGITLSKETLHSSRFPESSSTRSCGTARKVVTITSGVPRTMVSPCDAISLPASVGSIHEVNHEHTSVYSSASRASVHAQQQALRRRANSDASLVRLKERAECIAEGTKFKYVKAVGGKTTVGRSNSVIIENEMSPQTFLDNMLKGRSYSTHNYCSLEGAYYCKPTEFQKASYGIKLLEAVRNSDDVVIEKMLRAGISPNPCNAFGESVVHMVCRRGDFKLLKLFKDFGCSLQVTDDFGRTPLHDACWTAQPPFDIVDLILTTDRRLLHLVDSRGASPLSYVKRNQWGKWITFFQLRADTYWPPRDMTKECDEPPPPLCCMKQHSTPISDPPNALSTELAQQLVSTGVGALDEVMTTVARGNAILES